MSVDFTVPGDAVPERKRQRPTKDGFGHRVDVPAAAEYKARVALFASQACPEPFPRSVPLRVALVFVRVKPKSAAKRVRWPVTRPDTSNLAKLAEDACNGIVWVDDAQIVLSVIGKQFGPTPYLRVTAEPIDEYLADKRVLAALAECGFD